MTSSSTGSRTTKSRKCDVAVENVQVDCKPESVRRRWARVCGWVFAFTAIAFAGTTVYRGMRMVELRTLAIEASEALHAGQWQHLETVSQRWHEKDPKAGMAWLLAAQAADKLESPGRMARYIERMPDEDPNKLSWSRFWGPRVLLVSAFDDCFKLAR